MKFFLYFLIGIIVFQSCKPPEKSNYFEINLDSGWMFRKMSDTVWFPGQVPGNILHDLVINKQIDDPRICDNLNTITWIENEDWEYKVEFDVPDEILLQDSIYLDFEGLFPCSDIILNDSVINNAPEFLNNYSIACKKKLKQKQNTLTVRFYSPFRPNNEKLYPENSLQNEAFIPSTLINGTRVSPKQINFGILQPVKLIAWTDARIKNIYFTTDSISHKTAIVTATIEIESVNNCNCELTLDINRGLTKLSNSISLKKGIQSTKIELQVDKPDLWWCNGMGRQPLYSANVALIKEGFVISKKSVSFGIRKIELITQPDSAAFGFYFRLNNNPIFIKGANFIPSDIYQLDENTELYEQLTNDAVSANINMFRMWGGAIYERPEFYELCNKKGIMVWQDIIYSMNTSEKAGVLKTNGNKRSILQQIKKLQNYPCLALCFVSSNYSNKKGNIKLSDSLENMKKDINLNFPGTSVFIDHSKKPGIENTRQYLGTERTIWYEGAPLANIHKNNYPFVYEFGVQSLPDMKTTVTFTDENDNNLRSPILATHQFDQSPGNVVGLSGTQLISNYIQMYYNEPDNFESFIYLSQIFQAQALKYAVETYRTKQPNCMGSIFWHFNDCWPSISWSVIDNYSRLKPAYYAIKEAYKNIIIVPEINEQLVKIWAINDSFYDFSAELTALLIDFNGNIQFRFNDTIQVKPNIPYLAFSKPMKLLIPNNQTNKLLLYATLTKKSKLIAENVLYFCDPSFLDLPVPDIQLKIEDKGNGFLIIVNSDKLVKNLVFSTISSDCRFSNNNLDILPGEFKNIFAEYAGTLAEFESDLQMKSLIDSY